MKRKTIIKAVLYSILLLAITSIFLVSYLRLFDNYELETLDLRFALRPKAPVTDKVVIIEIGEDTIAKLGRFPFDRSYHAILIKALAESKAKAILFDIFFSEPEEHDTELEDAMRNAGNVYLPFVLDIDPAKQAKVVYAKGYTARTIERLRILARGEGHINIIPDTDGKFRRVPLYIRYGNNFYPHIAFLAICDYLGIPQKAIRLLPGHFLDLGNERYIPLDEHSQLLINFSGRWGRVSAIIPMWISSRLILPRHQARSLFWISGYSRIKYALSD